MTNPRIKLHCQCRNTVHDLPRTSEIPEDVTALACNYCPNCEDKMEDYYNEWYIDESELPPAINPNQLELFPNQ